MLSSVAAWNSWLGQLGPLAMSSTACAAAKLASSGSAHPQPRPYSTWHPSIYSLTACLREASLHAAAGSTAPTAPKQALEAAAEAVAGLWVFGTCGSWSPGTPRAGKPANALLHTMLYRMDRTYPVPVTQHDDLEGCYYYHSVYGLDSNGWPSGVLYPNLLWFEAQTTHQSASKPATSIKLMLNGQRSFALGTWVKRELKSQGAVLAPRGHTRTVRNWYEFAVSGVGIQVLDHDADLSQVAP